MFNLRVALPARDEVFLMNTLTDAQLVVSPDVAELLDRAAAGELPSVLGPTENERYALNLLSENGFLVENRSTDRRRFDDYITGVKSSTDELNVTILTTLQCNFACDYCFQGDHGDYNLHADKMSMATAARVGEWIERELDRVRPERLVLTFFGGEPLLNLPVMYQLSERLWNATQERGVKMFNSIITNGLLLTPEVVDRMQPFGLNGIKITLDGDRDTHNRMRPLRGGQGTFDRIIENIRRVAGRCRIAIGGNFDESSVESFPGAARVPTGAGLRRQARQSQLQAGHPRYGATGSERDDPADSGGRVEQAAQRHLYDVRRRRSRIDLRQLRFPRRQGVVPARGDQSDTAFRRPTASTTAPATCTCSTRTPSARTARCMPALASPANWRPPPVTSTIGKTTTVPQRGNVSTVSIRGKTAETARSCPCVRVDASRTRSHSLAT